MKKWFDKFIAQSSRGQMVALAAAFVVLAVAGGIVGQFVLEKDNPDSAKFGYRGTWGLMQCVDGGFVDATISANTRIASTPKGDRISRNAPVAVVVLSLGFWLAGMILISFFTGAATNFLDVRREKILNGSVDYSFRKKYILIVGYDFQTGNLIKKLFNPDDKTADTDHQPGAGVQPAAENRGEHPELSIVLVTDSDVAQIYDALLPELDPSQSRRLFIMRKNITQVDSYKKFLITGAEEIYLIGDGDAVGRDGKTLQALDALSGKAAREVKTVPQNPGGRRIKVYLHIADSVLYSNVRAIKLSLDALKLFDLDVFNYYESWAWECWSNKDADDGKDAYRRICHKDGTKHAELFVIGAGRMGIAMVNFAMPLMNYGGDGKHCRITIFDPDGSKRGLLPDQKTLDALPELEVVFRQLDGSSEEANALMLEAANREDTSVTVVIAIPDPTAAIRAYAGFSKELCRKEISVLIWQETDKESLPDKSYLRMGGSDSLDADKRIVRYFGMTDRLPWKNPARFDYGMAVNYYYNCWFPYGLKPYPDSPNAAASDFVQKADAMWNHTKPGESESKIAKVESKYKIVKVESEYETVKIVNAGTEWMNTPRWKKWSSVNSGDTFREKSVLFNGVPDAEAAVKILKAEHNRWWTEKILAGWLLSEQKTADADSHAHKSEMKHEDMIPFEDLMDEVKDKDKINIAAMAAYGFLSASGSARTNEK